MGLIPEANNQVMHITNMCNCPGSPQANGNALMKNANVSHVSIGRSPQLSVEEMSKLLEERVPFFHVAIDHDAFEASCIDLLRIAMPKWFLHNTPSLPDDSPIKLVQCKDGITNKLMHCEHIASGEVVLVRAYGKKSELVIDRQAELLTFVALQEDGLVPPLYGRFSNGFIYGFTAGKALKPAEMSNPIVAPLIACKLAQWHAVDAVPGQREQKLFRTLWKWFRAIPDGSRYSNPKAREKFIAHIKKAELEIELQGLELAAAKFNCPIVFCHNDLLSGNIIYDESGSCVSFIDYEYGSYNYRSFDIANHFCEYAGFTCDYSKYPDPDYQRSWLRSYLTEFNRITRGSASVTDAEIETALQEVALFVLAAHFFWGVWGLVQAAYSDIDFDYMSYACQRLAQYHRQKSWP